MTISVYNDEELRTDFPQDDWIGELSNNKYLVIRAETQEEDNNVRDMIIKSNANGKRIFYQAFYFKRTETGTHSLSVGICKLNN